MLSQTAWRIGRAFTQGKKSAPAEFAEIEREANGLSEALKLVAETLHSDGSVLDKAEDATKAAVAAILESAQRTLSDLESFVERYRIIRREQTSGGFVAESRTWSDVVLANYKTLAWTTEGGNIAALRDMLHVHTSTINLTMQALQTRSLKRLEKVVMPMAENVASIHDRVNGDLGDKIDELHHIITSVVNGTPALTARDGHYRLNSTASNGTTSTIELMTNEQRLIEGSNADHDSILPGRQLDLQVSRASANSSYVDVSTNPWRETSVSDQPHPLYYREPGNSGIDWAFESGAPPPSSSSISDRFAGSLATTAVPSPESISMRPERYPLHHHRMSNMPRRESTTLPNLSRATTVDNAREGARRESNLMWTPPESPAAKRRVDSKSPSDEQLPPPALSPRGSQNGWNPPATPASIIGSSSSQRHYSRAAQSPRIPSDARSFTQNSKHSSVATSPSIGPMGSQPLGPSGSSAFEKALFRNAAILCDVRCTLVEYAQHNPDEPDPRFDTEMVPACHEARVYVIRKRENRENGGTRVVASVWAISDDGEVRCQQKLPEYTDTVPYCSFFEPEKVAIPPAAHEPESTLRFHAREWGQREERDLKTKWTNYVFETEKAAEDFQSAVFGRQLLGSFRTVKTCVLHEGLKGAFAFEEQFANIEVLRIWEDDGVNTPGAAGGVMALLHMGGNFGQGWAKWWMNSSRQMVRVKDENNKFAKLKGIDVRVLRPPEQVKGGSGGGAVRSPTAGVGDLPTRRASDGRGGKKGPERNVTGVRVEFKTEDERARFVALMKRVQERVLPLPDI